MDDIFGERTSHSVRYNDLSSDNTIFGIPNSNSLNKVTVEINSIKTNSYGIQVVWKNSYLKDNWPIEQFIADGTVSCDTPGLIKSGTNVGGNVAARNNIIIKNTSDLMPDERTDFKVNEMQMITSDLQKPVLTNGQISNNVKWSEPVIYQAL